MKTFTTITLICGYTIGYIVVKYKVNTFYTFMLMFLANFIACMIAIKIKD